MENLVCLITLIYNNILGTADYTPIHFIFNSIDQVELASLYYLADICFVSSLRDGMNLVMKFSF